MTTATINMFSQEDPQTKHGWPFVYFHAECENQVQREWNDREGAEWCAPDLVGADRAPEGLEDGVYDVCLYDMKAKLYLWWKEANVIVEVKKPSDEEVQAALAEGNDAFLNAIYGTQKMMKPRGLIVLEGTPGEEYAKKKFAERTDML